MAGKIQNEDIKSSAELVSAGATAASLPNDDKIWVKANTINKTLNQAITDGDIGGSGGGAGKNYAPGSGKFTSITGWSAFNTTYSSGVPTTITTSSTKVAISLETSAPLSSPGSLKFDVTTASGSTGHGFISDAMTIDDQDLAQVFGPSINYWIKTGSSTLDLSGTSTQTFEWWIYNVGLAAWTQPANFRGMNASVPSALALQFQTDISNASNNNQYRIALIIRNDPTGTSSTLFDTFYFGRGPINFASLPVAASLYKTADQSVPTSTSTVVTWAAAETDTAGIWESGSNGFRIKETGYYVASAQIPWAFNSLNMREILVRKNGSVIAALGNRANQGATYDIRMGGSSRPLYLVAGDLIDLIAYQDTGSSVNIAGSYGKEYCNFSIFKVAASGAGSTSRVVAASYYLPSNLSVTNDTNVNFSTRIFDSHSAVTTGAGTWVFTAPVTDYYEVLLVYKTTTSAGTAYARKNGNFYGYLSRSDGTTKSAATLVQLNAGDTLAISTDTTVTFEASGGNPLSYVSIVSAGGGSYNSSAGLSVNARYTDASAQAIGTSLGVFKYATKDYDSLNAYDSSTGLYTDKVGGKFLITAQVSTTVVTLSTGQFFQLAIMKNGSLFSYLPFAFGNGGTGAAYCICGSMIVQSKAGDTWAVACQSSVATTGNTAAGINTFSIAKVGE